jgi:hypothetical protein
VRTDLRAAAVLAKSFLPPVGAFSWPKSATFLTLMLLAVVFTDLRAATVLAESFGEAMGALLRRVNIPFACILLNNGFRPANIFLPWMVSLCGISGVLVSLCDIGGTGLFLFFAVVR